MAGEMQLPYSTTGINIYAFVRDTAGQIWSTVAGSFGAYATGSIADYDTALAEQGTASRYYVGTFPAAITAGVYNVAFYLRAGGAPAEGDTLVGVAVMQWDGSAEIDLSDLAVDLSTQGKADVNAEMVDVLSTDTQAELAAVPTVPTTIKDMILWIYTLSRNQRESTASTDLVKKDDASTTVATAAISDDGTTTTRGEYA